eukprot:2952591-Prymnesium_polylepis.1
MRYYQLSYYRASLLARRLFRLVCRGNLRRGRGGLLHRRLRGGDRRGRGLLVLRRRRGGHTRLGRTPSHRFRLRD